jgi:hypothetical protein
MVTANYLGNFEIQGFVGYTVSKTATAITAGDILSLVSNKWQTAPVSASAPYAVARETKAAGDPTISVAFAGIGYIKADGTINPYAPLKISAATIGEAIAATIGTDAYDKIFGRYLGKENEGGGAGEEASAAADGDTIRIYFNGGAA